MAIGFAMYVFLVAALRDQRAHDLQKRFGMLKRDDYARMTADDSQAILKQLTELEFPKFMGFSIVFALFKTYGISTVSELLMATGELASSETASRRTADTGVLILEFALNKPSSERAIKAIARMNYLHARYKKAGKISNVDMLYTLSVFALEPVRWVNKYEWRCLTDMEVCASGTYWKAMGDAMEISFEELPSHGTGWKDGLHWLEEVKEWSLEYEERHMLPAQTNHDLADKHLNLIFLNVPKRLNVVGKKVVSVLVGERLQKAMMLPEASPAYFYVINGALAIRKLFLRYLALPRPEFLRKDYISAEPDKTTGRYSSKEYLSHPWYVRPTFKRRWGSRAWITRLLGRKLPGDDGNKYNPEGYKILELGPASQKGKGLMEMEATEVRLQRSEHGGCPFHAFT